MSGTVDSTITDSFLLFPKLPLELQRLICSFAADIVPRASPRIFRVAPDPKGWRRETGGWTLGRSRILGVASKDLRLSVFPDQVFSVPSLLLVCRDARMAVRGQYTVWGIADPESFGPSGRGVYINKIYDTIYFGDRFSAGQPGSRLLELLYTDHFAFAEWDRDHWEYSVPALQVYIDQLEGIQNIAMPGSNWPNVIHGANSTWLQHFPSLKELTVVLGIRNQHSCNWKPMRFTPIKLKSVQAESAQMIERRMQRGLDYFHQHLPDHPVPQFRIVAFLSYNNKDNSSSKFEVEFKRFLELDL
jgi:hypothetical protein